MTRLIDADALLKKFNENDCGMGFSDFEIHAFINNAPTVQREGWVSVPIEPTEEMVDAGIAYFKDTFDDIFQSKTHYKAMLSAAPKE